MLTVRPIGNRILVEDVYIERVTKGGIIKAVATTSTGGAVVAVGVVLDIGDGVPVDAIETGEIVHFNALSAQPITTNDKTYQVVSYDAILAVEDPGSVKILTDEEAEAGERRIVDPKGLIT